MRSSCALQAYQRIGATNLLKAPSKALEAAEAVPAALGALKIYRRFKPLYRRPVCRASTLWLGDENVEFDSGYIRGQFGRNESLRLQSDECEAVVRVVLAGL